MDRVIKLGPRGGKIVGYRHGAGGIEPIYATRSVTRGVAEPQAEYDRACFDITRSSGDEFMVVADHNGVEIARRRGTPTRVPVTAEDAARWRGKGVRVTHSHPNGASLGADDFRLLFSGRL